MAAKINFCYNAAIQMTAPPGVRNKNGKIITTLLPGKLIE